MESKTVFVNNLPLRTIKDEIRSHFSSSLQIDKGRVDVGPLVRYIRPEENIEEKGTVGTLQADFRIGTTVTFPIVPQWKETLRGKYFRPGNGPLNTRPKIDIAIKEEFIGLSGLEQHDKDSEPYSHEFEYGNPRNDGISMLLMFADFSSSMALTTILSRPGHIESQKLQ
jgi:RNA recognition motif-containing protein